MRLLLSAALCAVLLGGCPKAPPPPAAEKLPVTMEQQVLSDAWEAQRQNWTMPNTVNFASLQLIELRKQTAEMQAQTALLREIRDNTRRTP